MLLNKLQLIRLGDAEKQIHIFTRSPEQNTELRTELHTELREEDVGNLGLVVEEDLGDKSIQDFKIVVLCLMTCLTPIRN